MQAWKMGITKKVYLILSRYCRVGKDGVQALPPRHFLSSNPKNNDPHDDSENNSYYNNDFAQ